MMFPGDPPLAELRKRCWHYLTPTVASVVGLDVDQLRRFADGTIDLPDDALHQLALRLRMYEPQV